uniref:G_PROTEIN_RECEP_F1_2 domain-containing protein n=1 Tax=Caenorhabditis tropicalis TaxID=1561998 RepID=A0A1I7TXW0_9PELO
MWLPKTYLPYEVYLTTGWLAELGVSGIAQFTALGQCLNFIGVSILELFYHRFQAVVVFRSHFHLKLPFYILNIFRIVTLIHISVFIWGRLHPRTLMYQENKRVDLLKKIPYLPEELGCFTVSIAVPEDPNFIITVSIWGVLVALGMTVIISTVIFITQFLKKAQNLSSQTKKLQTMLVLSLVLQV